MAGGIKSGKQLKAVLMGGPSGVLVGRDALERALCAEDLSPGAGALIVLDEDRCILCGRCVRVCDDVQSVTALHAVNRGWDTRIDPGMSDDMADVVCVNCGQCINRCPTGALKANDPAPRIWDAIYDPDKHVIVQTAPAVRASIGEEFGMPPGSRVTNRMVTALRMLGFDRVFDTDLAADLTIVEESSELIKRVTEGGVLPQTTS